MTPNNPIIKDEDKELFLNTINQNGFLLEDKVWKILTTLEDYHHLNLDSRNKIFDHNNSRVEIDFIFNYYLSALIIECKKTKYSWIFPKAREREDTASLIYFDGSKIQCNSQRVTNIRTAWFDIAIMFKEDGHLNKKNTNADTAQVSYKDVHEHIKQILKEVEAYINSLSEEKLIIPTIVTNAKLYSLDYTKGGIDDDGNLTDFEPLKEIPYVIYNFPENIFYKNKLIKNKDIELDGVKSVFIVNSNHLKKFITSLRTIIYAQDYKYTD